MSTRSPLSVSPARPFVKWVGGKRALLPQILPFFPEAFETYYEPFAGGGAVFFSLNPDRAVLRDVNVELVTTYQVVRDQVSDLVEALAEHDAAHRRDMGAPHSPEVGSRERYPYYYSVRELDVATLSPVAVAARFIYLNRTCFNGLYRVNRSGKFNVPAGTYKNPQIVDEGNLRACSHALRHTDIAVGDFASVCPSPGDFVYLDPPYDPIPKENAGPSFTSYTADGFGPDSQKRLRDWAVAMIDSGVQVALSNHDTPLVRDLYSLPVFTIHEVLAPRNVNSKASERGAVAEVLVVGQTRR